ncbi:MAG: hypothetical protein ACRC2M_16895 [Planktothrix sp.]
MNYGVWLWQRSHFQIPEFTNTQETGFLIKLIATNQDILRNPVSNLIKLIATNQDILRNPVSNLIKLIATNRDILRNPVSATRTRP